MGLRKGMTKIQFINHASVKIYNEDCCLLSDPWYQGDAFHKGWNLLVELTDKEVEDLLMDVTHIWISHEHPDHFSILFFKKFLPLLKDNNVTILFQETKDKRVKEFFKKSGIEFKELLFEISTQIERGFNVTCFKDGFYDSGLLIETGDQKILNLNDCQIRSDAKADEIYNIIGECDLLLTQFSYAAWKGGKKNIEWREEAAKEKLDTLRLQVKKFNPTYLIPFASYVYFSNEYNSYLNDSVNTPQNVIDCLSDLDTSVVVMKPFDVFLDFTGEFDNNNGVEFWNSKYKSISSIPKHLYNQVEFSELNEAFDIYRKRVFLNNSRALMKFLSVFSPIKIFKPVYIHLKDLDETFCVDLFEKNLMRADHDAHLIMSSESLEFVFRNTFGFDTLTVNGCFEEGKSGGFSIATKTLAIENLNNMGIRFRLMFLFNFNLIMLFFNRLKKVSKQIL